MPYILRHATQQPIQTVSEPTYDAKYKGWRFDGQLLIDKNHEYWVDEGSLPPPEPPPPPTWLWVVDPYYFFNRMGAAEEDVLTTTDKKAVGIIAKFKMMWYVDLKSQQTIDMVNAIAARVPALTPAIVSNLLNIEAAKHENVVARKIFFV